LTGLVLLVFPIVNVIVKANHTYNTGIDSLVPLHEQRHSYSGVSCYMARNSC